MTAVQRQTRPYHRRPMSTLERRYHAALAQARAEARDATAELQKCLAGPCSLEKIAASSKRAQMSAARLCTAAADILSPP